MGALRAAEFERARAKCVTSLEAGHGAIMFIAGPPASGRSALLQGLARVLPQGPRSPRVLAGSIVEGRYVAAQPDPGRGSAVGEMAKGALGLGGTAFPVLGLVGQVVSVSQAAARAVRPPTPNQQPATLAELTGLLRTASREQPLACVVDDVDEADGRWWSELLLGFAGEVARDLPLLMILSVEEEDGPGPHCDDEPDALFAARHLVPRGLAEWLPLPRPEPNDLAALTGEAERDVLARLWELTEGRAGWAADLWGQWQVHGLVERDSYLGPWRFAPGQPHGYPATIAQVARERIRQAVGDDLALSSEAWQVLSCAALEGRYFTADVVATALGRDRDELIDLLDDRLAVSDERPQALVEEVGSVSVQNPRGAETVLWRYRFTSQLFRTALGRYGPTADERRTLSAALARGLHASFGNQSGQIAARLATLYTQAGDGDRAQHYRRLANSQMPASVVIEEARALLDCDSADWDWAQCRRATLLLLEAGRILYQRGPLDEGLAAGQRAALLARQAGLAPEEGRTLVLQGNTEGYMGAPDAARSHLEAGRAIYASIGDLEGEAEATKDLAWLDGLTDARDWALEGFAHALVLSRRLGDPYRELNLHMVHLNLAMRWEDDALARQALIDVERLIDDWGDQLQQTKLIETRGVLANRAGDHRGAAALYRQAAELYTEEGAILLVASATRGLGIALAATGGNDDEARQILRQGVVTAQSMDNASGQVEARHHLAYLEVNARNLDLAIQEFRVCVTLYRELGRSESEVLARIELARALSAAGDRTHARTELTQALRLSEQLGVEGLIAQTKQALNFLDQPRWRPPGQATGRKGK